MNTFIDYIAKSYIDEIKENNIFKIKNDIVASFCKSSIIDSMTVQVFPKKLELYKNSSFYNDLTKWFIDDSNNIIFENYNFRKPFSVDLYIVYQINVCDVSKDGWDMLKYNNTYYYNTQEMCYYNNHQHSVYTKFVNCPFITN